MSTLNEQHAAAYALRNELRRGDTAPVREPVSHICRNTCGCESEWTPLEGGKFKILPLTRCAAHGGSK